MNKWRERLLLFVWRNTGRHKVDPVQFAALHRSPGNCQMPAMYGIEGSTKQSYVHNEAALAYQESVQCADS